MDQSQAQIEDIRLDGERRLKYKGTARINLDVLYFRWEQLCKSDKKHIEKLERCFEKEGCHRLPLRNHVAAIINPSALDAAMRRSGVTVLTNTELACPELLFPAGFQLECLNGLHRILAGRKFLSPRDKWWAVDLYLSDLHADLKTCLAEEYTNEAIPSDGQIYYQMRFYHFQHNFSMEMRWKARLRGNREEYLQTLENHLAVREAFDALLYVPGLWDGMRISTLHTVMALNCDSQLLNYLRHIKQVWSDIVGGDRIAMSRIDQVTVKTLERMAPQASTADAELLQSEVLGGKVFKAFNAHERGEIWHRLQKIEGFIPSLATFFEDVDYLGLLANCVKRLTGSTVKKPVSEHLELLFTGVNQEDGRVKIQVREDSFVDGRGIRADQIDLGCRQIWAFAMRYYPDMPKDKSKKDRVKKAEVKADPAVLRRFGDLANALGFMSPGIRKLLQYPSAHPMHQNVSSEGPFLVTSGLGEEKSKRRGVPFISAYDAELEFLFINHLHDGNPVHGEGITSFFIRKYIYLAFFGRPARMPAMYSGSVPTDDLGDLSPGSGAQEQDQPDGLRTNRSPAAPDPEEEADLFVSDTDTRQSQTDREDSEEREQREREQREQEQREREREREQQEREQREQEQREREREQREREQREREQREQEQREQEQREQEQREREHPKIEINFARWEDNMWKHMPALSVDLENPSIVEETIEAYMVQRIRAFNTKLLMMAPDAYFQAVINDRTHTILLVPQDKISIDNRMIKSAAMLHEEAIKKVIGLKRTATDDPSETQHPRKMRRGTATVDGR